LFRSRRIGLTRESFMIWAGQLDSRDYGRGWSAHLAW
jgi:hypothetical protein